MEKHVNLIEEPSMMIDFLLDSKYLSEACRNFCSDIVQKKDMAWEKYVKEKNKLEERITTFIKKELPDITYGFNVYRLNADNEDYKRLEILEKEYENEKELFYKLIGKIVLKCRLNEPLTPDDINFIKLWYPGFY